MAEPIPLRGNQPLLLEPQGACWRVSSGSLALFSVRLKDGQPWGARTFLFSVEEGEALFGLGAVQDNAKRAVLAVPIQTATVIEGSALGIGHELPPLEAIGLVARWTQRWSETLDLAQPVAEEGGDPLDFGDWLVRLAPFHRWVLQALARRADTARFEEVKRVEERSVRSTESGRIAVAKLSAVLTPADEREPPVGNALFRAAFAVGQELGVEIKPLPRSVNARRVRDPLMALARSSQLRLRKVLLRGAWWRQDNGHLLAFERESGDPIALLRQPGGAYELFDPADDRRVPVNAHTAETLEPEANMFYRPFPSGPLGVIDLVRFALLGRKYDVLGVLAVGVLATLLAMAMPVATGVVVDHAIPNADRSMLGQLFLGLLAAAFGATLFNLSSGILMMRIEAKADADTQAAVWDRLLRLRVGFFRRFSVGDLKSRVSAVSSIRAALSGTTLRSLFASFMALLNLGLLFYYSVPLALVACATAAVTAAVTAFSTLLLLRYERTIQELGGEIFGTMIQLIQGITKLRVAAAEERAFLHWAEDYSKKQDLIVRTQHVKDLLNILNLWVGVGSLMVLFWVAEQLIRQPGPGLTAGGFLAFNAAYGAFLGGVAGLSSIIPDLTRIKILEERAQPILESEPEVDEHKADPGRLRGHLALEQVVFRYTHDGPLILNDVTLRAEPGEMIALVGPSGSGKSTILRLLLGFEVPESGQVLVDGQDLRGVDMQAVRQQYGVVLQAGRINAGSIFENVAGGSLVTLGEVKEAIRMAGLEDDVAEMPMGLHTVISEGGMNLSGGQRQRLLIARALVLEPKVLLFDEATSALDNKTQAVVTESLNALDVTRVVIAHRLSTIREADRIYVIDKGHVVEAGDFDTLLAADGLFTRLMRRQMA